MESAVSFVLGAVAGGALGATETPVNHILTEITSGPKLNPVSSGVRSVGPLGLGVLVGTTALITSMTAAVTGVIAAAAVASFILRRTEGWPAAGLAAALATTSSGAALGALMDRLTASHGMVSLLWPLGAFTVLALLMQVCVKTTCKGSGTSGSREQARLLALEVDLRQRVALEAEQRMNTCEMEKPESLAAWEVQRRKREEINRAINNTVNLEMQATASRRRLRNAVTKYVEFLAFSGIPMTVIVFVTTGLGIFGFGGHRFVFVVLLVLVLSMSFWLMKSRQLNFWMFMACMGMFATFAIAVLTVHAGQDELESSAKMWRAGQDVNKESIVIRMMHTSSVQAVSAGFFVAEVCLVALGATAGGPLAREVGGRVIAGGAVSAVVVALMVNMQSLVLGVGGAAGALLGAVGGAGVALGGAAAAAIKSFSQGQILTTTAGMICGYLVFGKWNIVNIGLKVCVAYVFAMTDLY